MNFHLEGAGGGHAGGDHHYGGGMYSELGAIIRGLDDADRGNHHGRGEGISARAPAARDVRKKETLSC